MASSSSRPALGGGLTPRGSSYGASTSDRPSTDGGRSHDPLLSSNDTVPDAPQRTQVVPVENPTQAMNRPIVLLEPKVITADDPKDLQDLTFWPTILQPTSIVLLVLLYTTTATSIGVLMWKSLQDPNHNYRLSSENVHMISRYFPSIVGTVTVLLFRQTVREALRMVPFTSMADQKGIDADETGSPPWIGVGGAWFPWQSFTTTPKKFISIFSLVCQFVATFIVSFKVALFANAPPKFDTDSNEAYWILTVRVYPAIVLIAGYILMIVYTLYVAYHFYGKSTGLKWDPATIADYAALFAHCNALQYFAPLELLHDLRPKHVMVPKRKFRLGYWKRKRQNMQEDIVYGIGVGHRPQTDTGHDSLQHRTPLGRPWYQFYTSKKSSVPLPVDDCKRPYPCSHGTWPNCEHYPYNYNPGCSRWLIFLGSLLSIGCLVLSIYGLAIRLPNHGFSLPNDLKLPSGFHYGFGPSNHTLPPIDPSDPNSTVLLWALMFRSIPTYIAGMFTSTIITWIDLNMRFMQPFRNMFGKGPKRNAWQVFIDYTGLRRWFGGKGKQAEEERIPAEAEESILLAYLTVSPLQVPLTAWDKGHYKVCIYSTLNTFSPLFPIFVGGLLIVTPDEQYDRVNFTFSLSAYIGIMIYLALYSILLPSAMPGAYRLLPRQLYSLADLMALCHESKFMASPHLDITHRSHTPTKQHMEARLLLEEDDRFLFGVYQGRDGNGHVGFDVQKDDSVRHIPPEGFIEKTYKSMTNRVEAGWKTVTGSWVGNSASPFSQKRALGAGEEHEMSGGVVSGEASGSQARFGGETGRTRTGARVEPSTP